MALSNSMAVSNRKVVMSHPFVSRTKKNNTNNLLFVSCSELDGKVTNIIVKEAVLKSNFHSQLINFLSSFVSTNISVRFYKGCLDHYTLVSSVIL
jgi:hypothetical protein